jgi:hypothetical protein
MSGDLDLAQQEEDFEDARERAICNDAAIFVVEEYSREDALNKAEQIFTAQQEAQSDITGVTGTLSETRSPRIPLGKEAQVKAIADELYKSRN